MFRVQKRQFFYGIFQMFIWRSTVHLREPVAENRLLPYLLLTKLGGECSHLFLVRNDQNSPNLAWLYSKRWFLPLAPPNEGCSPKGTFEKAHRKWPFLHHKHEMNWPTKILWLDRYVEMDFWAKKLAKLVIPVRSTFHSDLHLPIGGPHCQLDYLTRPKKSSWAETENRKPGPGSFSSSKCGPSWKPFRFS